MIFYRISVLMLPTLIQRYDKKNHFIFDSIQKRETNVKFTGVSSGSSLFATHPVIFDTIVGSKLYLFKF